MMSWPCWTAAHARHATVRVERVDGQLLVEVSDDGVGGADLRTPGHGLAGLADRVAALEGTFDVQSESSRGTTLRAEIPLPN
jgi:signal transduction histidine kinase